MNTVKELKAWRTARDLNFEQAAERVLVDGVPANKSTWHAWETGRKVPSKAFMTALYELTGGEVRPEHFYHLPRVETSKAPISQPLLV